MTRCGVEAMAEALDVSIKRIYQLTDPDDAARPSLDQIQKLDHLFQREGGTGAPLGELVHDRSKLDLLPNIGSVEAELCDVGIALGAVSAALKDAQHRDSVNGTNISQCEHERIQAEINNFLREVRELGYAVDQQAGVVPFQGRVT